MPTHGDLFQMIVTIPNASGRDLWEHIAVVMREFEQASVRVKGRRTNLVSGGRSAYLRLLAQRGRHHLRGAERIQNHYRAALAIPYWSPIHGNRVRDFYHDAYYAAFYAARYGMVFNGEHDCSQHKEIGKALDARLGAVIGAPLVPRTKRVLEELKDLREDADYVMNTARLGALASPAIMTTQLAEVGRLYIDWGIP
jgi:uncharacterized protein (UPF0332 family)